MKKIMLKSTIVLLLLFSFLKNCNASIYKFEDIDLKLSIDDSYEVFSKNNITGNPNLKKYGLTEASLKKKFEENNIYINAILDYNVELLLQTVDNPYEEINNLSNCDDKYLERLLEDYQSISSIKSANIYKGHYKYILTTQYINDCHVVSYYTIVNNKGYKLWIQKTDNITENEKLVLKEIVDSLEFKIEKDIEDEEIKKIKTNKSKKYIFSAIKGALIAMSIVLIINFIKKIKKG